MAVVINTNVDSLKIQNLLSSSTSKMSTSMQRMSSGLKILSAKDDAAGSVISARMQVQLNGNKIAQNNVQNGNAMLASAEGNIDVVLDNVSRIRDLTLQAKNGTYSYDEIVAMQDEVGERIAEIDRISNSAKYSQLGLFSDSDLQKDGVTFQVGANPTEDDVIAASAEIFKSVKFDDITGFKTTEDEVYAEDTGLATKATLADATGNKDGKVFVQITEAEYWDIQNNGTAAEIAAVSHYKGFDTATDNELNKDHEIADLYFKSVDQGDGMAAYALPGDGDVKAVAKVTTDGQLGLDLKDADIDYDAALTKLDDAIDNLTARKSQIGSAQNRLDSALSTLTIQNENLSSANSIITDADIASEASSFTQQQILQQVSTSLLAQANQAPSIALSLI